MFLSSFRYSWGRLHHVAHDPSFAFQKAIRAL